MLFQAKSFTFSWFILSVFIVDFISDFLDKKNRDLYNIFVIFCELFYPYNNKY